MAPLQYSCLENPMDGGAWKAAVHGVAEGWTRLSDFTFTFHFHALEKEMATQSSVLAWRIPGTGEPGGLLSAGSHRVGHDWSDLAIAIAMDNNNTSLIALFWGLRGVRDKKCPGQAWHSKILINEGCCKCGCFISQYWSSAWSVFQNSDASEMSQYFLIFWKIKWSPTLNHQVFRKLGLSCYSGFHSMPRHGGDACRRLRGLMHLKSADPALVGL